MDIGRLRNEIELALDESDDPPETAHLIVHTVIDFLEEAGDEETIQSLMESFD